MKIKKISFIFVLLLFVLQLGAISFADSDDDDDYDYDYEDDYEYDNSSDDEFYGIGTGSKDEYGPGNPNGKRLEQNPIETTVPANGPEVVEYYDYTTPREVAPGTLSGEVNFDYVGRGLYYDGEDFFFFLDTGILATNYMYNMEGDRFYFGDDGKMVRDELVYHADEMYFFDKNGAMLKNSWLTLSHYDQYEKTTEYTTYYFGRTGRAYKAVGGQGVALKDIDGDKYGFNSDGELLKGFVDIDGNQLDPNDSYAYADCLFYFDPDDDYAAYSGWFLYEPSMIEEQYEDFEEVYLYFDPKTHRKVKSANYERYLSRTIDNERYLFDNNGIRVTTWNGAIKASNSNVRYYNEEYDGYLSKGWFSAVPSKDSVVGANYDSYVGNDEKWFYATKNGSILRKCIRKLGKYIYAFDHDGVMQSDKLVVVSNGVYDRSYDLNELTYKEVVYGSAEGGILNDGEKWMYFTDGGENEDLEGTMCKTNSLVSLELKDEEIKFICNNQGGYSNKVVTDAAVRSGRYIQNGAVLMPKKDDNKYGIVRESATEEITIKNFKNWKGDDLGDQSGLKYWVVNRQGKKVSGSNSCYKDSNGNYIFVGENGVFLGYSSAQGKFVNGKWRYRDPDEKGKWHDTFPPQEYELDPSDLFLNFEILDNSLSDLMY